MFGADGVDRGAHQVVVEGREVFAALEYDVGGVLELHEAPVVAGRELGGGRTEMAGIPVELAVEGLGFQPVGDPLGQLEVLDLDERVVDEPVADLQPVQPRGQPGVPVEAELQAEGSPPRHSQVAQPQVGVDEVEVVVEALAAAGPEERISRAPVLPDFEGGAGFEGAEDVHQPRMAASPGEDLLDAVFLAEGLDPPDVLDGQPVLLREPRRLLEDGSGETLDELLEVGDLETAAGQFPCERPGMADVGERARHENAVKAREHAEDTGCVAVDEHGNLASRCTG